MKRAIISIFFIANILSGCVDKHKTEKLEEILDLKLQNLFENAKEDGMHPDVQSVYNAMKMLRNRNHSFDKKDEDSQLFTAIKNEINWYWLTTSYNDSVAVCSQIETIREAKTKEDAILEELTLFTLLDNVIYKNYYHFKSITPVVIGKRKELKIGESDTLRFMIAGISSTLKNLVYIGNIEALKDSSFRETRKPIYNKQNNKEEISYSEYILKAENVGKYSLTGVIEKPDKGKRKILPFEYEYIVKQK